MNDWESAGGTSSLNVLSMHAGDGGGHAGPELHQERARPQHGRARLHDEVVQRPRHEADRSHTNFMFVNIGRPVAPFREACAAKGVRVARNFPPFENTHCRISFGTMDEMQKAVKVFGEVLGKAAATNAA
jgi:histidinol-phosphate/aromatic aminotransferase/cobyric acid decarboxylase-like protein